ncbi:hypothetical protein MY55_13780 [Chromobacterium subtsugae]|nr:hypothetical protein MY55_13780 [Chromobacterium subtsugae]
MQTIMEPNRTPYTLDLLSDELDMVIRALKSGQPTLWEAKQLTQRYREVFIDQTRDLLPAHEGCEQTVAGRLLVVQELELALDRFREIGVSPKTRMRDVPCLDTALRYSLDEAAAGRPGGISFR